MKNESWEMAAPSFPHNLLLFLFTDLENALGTPEIKKGSYYNVGRWVQKLCVFQVINILCLFDQRKVLPLQKKYPLWSGIQLMEGSTQTTKIQNGERLSPLSQPAQPQQLMEPHRQQSDLLHVWSCQHHTSGAFSRAAVCGAPVSCPSSQVDF